MLSEVGSKDSSVEYTADEWTQWLSEELEAGAWKVITEAREGGTAGIFDAVRRHAHRADRRDRAAPSAPRTSSSRRRRSPSQAWFIKHFGPTVNLGNIPPDEVIPLETLRLGLRGDTLKEVLLGEPEPAAS